MKGGEVILSRLWVGVRASLSRTNVDNYRETMTPFVSCLLSGPNVGQTYGFGGNGVDKGIYSGPNKPGYQVLQIHLEPICVGVGEGCRLPALAGGTRGVSNLAGQVCADLLAHKKWHAP